MESFEDTAWVTGVKRIWLMGPPGSGKSFMAEWISKNTNGVVLHIGERLRETFSTDWMLRQKNIMESTEVDVVVWQMVQDMMLQTQDSLLIVDAFPRNVVGAQRVPCTLGDRVVILNVEAELRATRIADSRYADRQLLADIVTRDYEEHFEEVVSILRERGAILQHMENNQEKTFEGGWVV